MSVWEHIVVLLFGKKTEPCDAARARELSESISRKADRINEHLRNYQRARDPFAAMMADLYNRDQLSRLHKGDQH
jgi:hypothetical protein